MPRNGSGIYSKPAGSTAVAGTKIEAAKFNAVVDDFAQDANAVRPPSAGGTGGASIEEAREVLELDRKQILKTKSADYTVVAVDNNAMIRCTAALTLSLTSAAALGADWHIFVHAYGGNVTIDPSGSETINGTSTLIIPTGYESVLYCDGSAFYAAPPKRKAFADKSANYTAGYDDDGAFHRATNAITVSLAAAAALGGNWSLTIHASNGDVVIDPNGSETIDGATTITIPNGRKVTIYCTGSGFLSDGQPPTVILSTAISMSSTAVNFTGIPAAAKRVTITLNGMSTNGTSNIALRIGPSSGVETTGYVGNISGIGTDSVGTQSAGGSALNLLYTPSASEGFSGKITLEKVSGNLWEITSFIRSTITTRYLMSGSKTLASALERVQIFTANGTDTFDAGTANISWEL